jgi:hypothetical protein
MRMAPTLTLSGLAALVHDLSAVETVNNDGTNPLSGLYPARQTSTPTKKAPREMLWGFHWRRPFSRRAHTDAARGGNLAYGSSADHSGGTAADSHGLPRFPACKLKT